ncbi:ATP-binding cassette domain-containing protein [Anoxynatronum buryatiense]|uniref:Tungstate transport system ATP-binding protein n=1 Tax=Anoxynatronum buryatiense TaxID=489973 RepID=A0AA45WTT2_9CLOT|nr:ATP-binding cassette domain-containing protein [Anoxynatronum buryatiense]SMP44574.1 tungstate transport system ATP-binding protein [Anoxynatronum buryatiense]
MHLFIEHLTKSYDEKKVLDISRLEIDSGCFWGIIGPNGSGKSTLLKIISSLTAPCQSRILYDGLPLNDRLLLDMTLVFQKPYLLRTSVFQNIAYPLQLRHVSSRQLKEQVEEMLTRFQIEHLRDQKAWTLSGGEAQKVALARALVFKPRLIMLDEPTANIDPTSILLLEKQIRIHYETYRPTVLMVTHNLQQTKRMCDQVAFLHEGTLQDAGPLEKVFGGHAHPLVHSFIQQGLI